MKNLIKTSLHTYLYLLFFSIMFAGSSYANTHDSMPKPPANPTIVQVGAFVSDIIDMDELNEGLQINLILQFDWFDPRLAFDPKKEGINYKLYQGNFQFDEIYQGWWPQITIMNEIGPPQIKAIQIKVYHDGHIIMREQRTLIVETPMKLRKFPFDRQNLKVQMIPFGNSADEVKLIVDPESKIAIDEYIKNNPDVNIAEWNLSDYKLTADYPVEYYYGNPEKASRLTLELVLDRKPLNIMWKILLPLLLLVLGMWSIFWMDKEALSDRLNISFIGILSVIAYQFLIEGEMPRIDYFTFTDSFMLISFAILFTTILESLLIAFLMKKSKENLANIVDISFRFIFPSVYFISIILAYLSYVS